MAQSTFYLYSLIYKIYIKDLFEAYLKIHNILDYEVKEILLLKTEKITEDLDFDPEIIEMNNINDIVNLIKNEF